MKLTTTLALASALTVSVIADRNFVPPNDKSWSKIKTKANFIGGGAKMELCPSGDCASGQLVTLSMSRLQEVDTAGRPVQKAANFASLSETWSPFEAVVINGIDASTTSFAADVPVGTGKSAVGVKFNLTASIYTANGIALNGNQTVEVPAGALKFTVSIVGWPFESPDNHLEFGVNLKARGVNSTDVGMPNKKAKTGANATYVDRVDMGQGMFMDAPTLAVIDGVDTPINSTIEGTAEKLVFVWSFPSFTSSLYYDPVTGSEDPTGAADSTGEAGVAPEPTPSPTPAPTPAPTPEPTTKSPTSRAIGVSAMGVLSTIAVAAIATAFSV